MEGLENGKIASCIDGTYLTRWLDKTRNLLIYGDVDSTDTLYGFGDRFSDREVLSQSDVDDPSTHVDSGYIQRLSSVISEVNNDMDTQRQRQRLLLSRLVSMKDGVSAFSPLLDTRDLFVKLRHYKRLTLKHELMKLSKAIAQLQSYQHVRDIPSLVFGISGNNSLIVLPHLRIYKVIKDTVKAIKGTLLTQFHKLFEDHLLGTQQGGGSSDGSDKSSLWQVFLAKARDWLLAYALVSLLSVVLTETDNMVLDAFKDALDEALTPIWGRFHYHLEIARQAKSSLQIVWTFNYCKSFVQMICDLSAQMTSSGELKLLCNVDYAKAGLQQVLQKAVKFMRAHIAITITEFSPMTQELCIQVVEETLELDQWFFDLVSLLPGYSRGNMVMSIDTICPVLYDSKETFHQWISVEHDHCKSRLRFKLSKVEKIFSFRFAHDRRGSTMIGSGGEPTGQYRCYAGVFDCIGLFFTVCRRYVHLPDPAQRILSVFILEPLLCSIIALLLYRIRSNRTLFKISLGSYTHDAYIAETELKAATPYPLPVEFLEFIDSAQYVQGCFSSVDDRVRCIKTRSSALFRSECWSVIQTWMPKVLITRKEQLEGEHSTVELIEKIWSLSDDLIHSRNNYSYRGSSLLSKQQRLAAESNSINNKMSRQKNTTTDVKHQPDGGLGCLGDSIHVAKSLANTLCNVMNTQMKLNAL